MTACLYLNVTKYREPNLLFQWWELECLLVSKPIAQRSLGYLHTNRQRYCGLSSWQLVLGQNDHVPLSQCHQAQGTQSFLLFFAEEWVSKGSICFKASKPLFLLQPESLRHLSSPLQCEESVASCCCMVWQFSYAAFWTKLGTECYHTEFKLGLNGLIISRLQ